MYMRMKNETQAVRGIGKLQMDNLASLQNVSLFNLVVRANPDAPMLESRMLEGTREEVRQLLCTATGGYDLRFLSGLPTVMTAEFSEDDQNALAVVGYMDLPSLNPTISHPVMRVPSTSLLNCGLIGRWGNARTHWKVCEGDPFRLLAPYAVECSRKARRAESARGTDSQLAAVMMPFAGEPELDSVYQSIRKGAAEAGFRCKRVDEIATPTDITEDVLKLIEESGVVIVDISGKNPNVMFELGYAQGCGKQVVVLCADDLSDLPFDVRQRRTIQYRNTVSGLGELAEKIARSLRSLKQ